MQIKNTLAAVLALALTVNATKCVTGPKHAGDKCEGSNLNALTCGPGTDGNLVSHPSYNIQTAGPLLTLG